MFFPIFAAPRGRKFFDRSLAGIALVESQRFFSTCTVHYSTKMYIVNIHFITKAPTVLSRHPPVVFLHINSQRAESHALIWLIFDVLDLQLPAMHLARALTAKMSHHKRLSSAFELSLPFLLKPLPFELYRQ